MSNDATVIDDHTSDDALQYTGSWTHLLGISDAVNNTLSYTTEVGATVEFKFNGTHSGPSPSRFLIPYSVQELA